MAYKNKELKPKIEVDSLINSQNLVVKSEDDEETHLNNIGFVEEV